MKKTPSTVFPSKYTSLIEMAYSILLQLQIKLALHTVKSTLDGVLF
jgi:hypothetical protein